MQKTVILTGASSGIGKATAIQLLNNEYIVIAAARRLNLMDDLKNAGADVQYLDITDCQSTTKLVNYVVNKYKHIDVLINNAGYGLYGAVADVPIEMAKKQYDVNLFGLAKITQLVLPVMQNQKTGTIINISSIGGKIYSPFGAWYHSTKHAVEGFSDCLRVETKKFGIKVIIIEPGFIQSEWSSIAGNNVMEISGKGDYSELAKQFDSQLKSLYDVNKSSSPDVIAKIILKAVKSRNPKTRYAAGRMAKLMLFSRKVLSDKAFDFILNMQMKYKFF